MQFDRKGAEHRDSQDVVEVKLKFYWH